MLVGKDFEPITFELYGTLLSDPVAFIGDVIIFLFAIYYAVKIKRLPKKGPFYTYWIWFNIVFGFGFLIGGFGHLFFEQWGVNGKYIPWYSGIISCFFLEYAMLCVLPLIKLRKNLKYISLIKLTGVIAFATYIYLITDLTKDFTPGLMIPTINSVLGLGFGLLVLGIYYYKTVSPSFKYFWYAGLLLFPSAIVQIMKINISPFIDRNTISHILLVVSLMLYFKGIKTFSETPEKSID